MLQPAVRQAATCRLSSAPLLRSSTAASLNSHRTVCGECIGLLSNRFSMPGTLRRHIHSLQAELTSPIIYAVCKIVVTRVAGNSGATDRSTLDCPIQERRGTPPLRLPTRLRMTAQHSPWSHHRFMTPCEYKDMRGKWSKHRHLNYCVVQLAAQGVDLTTSIPPFFEHYRDAMLEPAQPPA